MKTDEKFESEQQKEIKTSERWGMDFEVIKKAEHRLFCEVEVKKEGSSTYLKSTKNIRG